MIVVDSTPFEEAAPRKRDRRLDATCGYCKQRVPKGHECDEKREALKERPCALATCGKPFKPSMHSQAYCCPEHKQEARNHRERPVKKKPAGGPKKGFKEELNTIAPLERTWERAEKQAQQYAPVMGEALVEITLRLMRAA